MGRFKLILVFIQMPTSSTTTMATFLVTLIITIPLLPAPPKPPPHPLLNSPLLTPPIPLTTITLPGPSNYLEGQISIRSAMIVLVMILFLTRSSGAVGTRSVSGE